MTTVVNMSTTRIWDVRIDRGTLWGNKYVVGRDGTREECIAKWERDFHERLENDPDFRSATLRLSGRVLGCWCAPLPCHGDIIAEWLNERECRAER